MKSILLPVPPRTEQDQIVRYLDWQVSKINRLIAAKRKQIDLLKNHLKSAVVFFTTHGLAEQQSSTSKIFWLTSYPSAWRVTKLKYILIKHKRQVPPEAELLVCSNSGKAWRGEAWIGCNFR